MDPRPPRSVIAALLFGAAVLLPSSSLRADTLTLQDGLNSYAGTEDTMINAGLPIFNWGNYNLLELTNGGGNPMRLLIRFDVSQLAGQFSSINSVTLRLFPVSVPSGAVNVQLFEPVSGNADWIEGTGAGAPVTPGTPSWRNKVQITTTTGTPWVGGEGLGSTGFGPLLAQTQIDNSTTTLAPFDLTISNTAAATGLINDFLGANNPGFLIHLDNETSTGNYDMLFYSREINSANTSTPNAETLRPELIIDFTPTPEPATAGLLLLGLGGLVLRRQRAGRAA